MRAVSSCGASFSLHFVAAYAVECLAAESVSFRKALGLGLGFCFLFLDIRITELRLVVY